MQEDKRRDMQCIILAGGLGTRMKPLTDTLPKWLLPVAGRPFAEWQLDWLAAQGIKQVIVSIGEKGGMIADYMAISAGRWPFDIHLVDDGVQLRGTGGAVRNACDLAELTGGVIVLYGDSFLTLDLPAVWTTSKAGAYPVMTVLRNEGRWDASNVRIEGDRVALYDKSRERAEGVVMDYIDYGLSVLPVDTVMKEIPADTVFDLADLLRDLSIAGRLRAFEVTERFYEIGSPGGLADLEQYLAENA